jgi:hypothetical protein
MTKIPKTLFLLGITLPMVLSGCANKGANAVSHSSNPERVIQNSLKEFDMCINNTPKGNQIQCANQLYTRLNSSIRNSAPEKTPALMAANKLYTLFSTSDRGEISSPQELQNRVRLIMNEMAMDVQKARYFSDAQDEIERRRQQQLFQDAQRFLAPVQSPVQTCTPAYGAPPGTLVCR